jgi:hypothetical protein
MIGFSLWRRLTHIFDHLSKIPFFNTCLLHINFEQDAHVPLNVTVQWLKGKTLSHMGAGMGILK